MHSEVGNTCVGAKINGRIVPLRYTLQNGDIVDILTQAGHLPSKDWLSIAKTSRARNKIKHVINANERERAIEIGQKISRRKRAASACRWHASSKADLEARGRRVRAEQDRRPLRQPRLRQILGPPGAAEIRTGAGGRRASPAARGRAHHNPAPRRDDDSAIKVHGVDDVMVYRAKCCNPIKGESIVGYVTRGKGIAVHSSTCPNVQNLMYDSERKIEVEWERHATDTFPVRIVVQTDDRPGILHQLTTVLATENTNVRSLEAKTDFSSDSDAASVEMTVDVRDKKQLEKLCTPCGASPASATWSA